MNLIGKNSDALWGVFAGICDRQKEGNKGRFSENHFVRPAFLSISIPENAVGLATKGAAMSEVEIEITRAMIDAGVDRLREFCFGQSEAKIVESVYMMMEIERRAQEMEVASVTNSSKYSTNNSAISMGPR